MISTDFKWALVLLAAGRARRMGRPKLLLPWGETSILGHQIQDWQRLQARQIAVVCAQDDNRVPTELDRLGFPASDRIFNAQPELGMFSSIRCAAQWPGWEPSLTHWIITLGDQPHLKPETLRTLLRFSSENLNQVCQPRSRARLHHPVVLPQKFFLQLRETPAATFKDFLHRIDRNIAGIEIEDAGLDFDIDTPADYERACAEFPTARRSRADARSADPV